MARRFRKPTRAQYRRAAALDIQWVVHVKMGGYQEPRPSERRHHWIGRWWTSVRSYERTQFPECLHCGLLMKSDGSHTRTCFGAGRP